MAVVANILRITFGSVAFAGWMGFVYPNFGKLLGHEPGPTDYLLAGLAMLTIVWLFVYVLMKFIPGGDEEGQVVS